MDTASPVGTNKSSQHEGSTVIYQERRVGRREKALFTCGAEYDLYRRGHAERKHEIVQQRARRKGGDLEQPLRDGHLTRFEPREPGARRGRGRVPGYERWQLLGRDEEHLRERECRPCNKSVSRHPLRSETQELLKNAHRRWALRGAVPRKTRHYYSMMRT